MQSDTLKQALTGILLATELVSIDAAAYLKGPREEEVLPAFAKTLEQAPKEQGPRFLLTAETQKVWFPFGTMDHLCISKC
jgi:hypothetical protein